MTLDGKVAVVTGAGGRGGPLPIGRLGAALGVGKPAASLLVDALVGHGCVVRSEDPADRRRTLVNLSEHGQEVVNELRQDRLERLSGWLGQLDEGDLVALARGLRALVRVALAESPACSA